MSGQTPSGPPSNDREEQSGRMSKTQSGCLVAFLIGLGLFGWMMWAAKVPHAIKTAYWPVETFYSVHAELEFDGRTYLLEGTGRCDWTFSPFGIGGAVKLTKYGGFLTKVLEDGRAIVIFPAGNCAGPAGKMFNQQGLFYFEEDKITGDIRTPKGTRHYPHLLRDTLPPVLVLDNAGDPKSIRYYPNPREHMATDCASLRILSYRISSTSSGTITRQELDVPYLANLAKQESWRGFMARFVPFSTFDPVPWVIEVLERQPPFTAFWEVFPTRGQISDWRYVPDWEKAEANTKNPEDRWTLQEKSTGRKVYWRTIDLRSTPPREIAWDPATGVVPLPPRTIGSCPAVTTLYRPSRPIRVEFKYDGATISRDLSTKIFRIFPKEQLLVSIEDDFATFDPRYFERQP